MSNNIKYHRRYGPGGNTLAPKEKFLGVSIWSPVWPLVVGVCCGICALLLCAAAALVLSW